MRSADVASISSAFFEATASMRARDRCGGSISHRTPDSRGPGAGQKEERTDSPRAPPNQPTTLAAPRRATPPSHATTRAIFFAALTGRTHGGTGNAAGRHPRRWVSLTASSHAGATTAASARTSWHRHRRSWTTRRRRRLRRRRSTMASLPSRPPPHPSSTDARGPYSFSLSIKLY
jgi:hypothetical protein